MKTQLQELLARSGYRVGTSFHLGPVEVSQLAASKAGGRGSGSRGCATVPVWGVQAGALPGVPRSLCHFSVA